jgi:hypothetical protein
MAVSNLVAGSSGLSVTRFPAAIGNPFQVPAGLTLQNTVTSTTTFTAGQLPAQVWAVIIGGGGGGSRDQGAGGGGGGACIGWVDVPSSGITATIGAGGAAGISTSGQYYGQPGGNTFFGAYVAYGGGGGMSTNDSWASSGNGPFRQIFPRGPGAAYGGIQLNSFANTTTTYSMIQGCAPFLYNSTTMQGPSTSTTVYRMVELYELYANNYTGGGAGGSQQSSGTLNYAGGGSGLTGGGGTWTGSTGANGGNSSRNGGVSNTFTGSSGNSSGYGGGGAGLLANGSAPTGSAAGAGGSGGGGGGGTSSWTLNPGAGGAGCVLIYY